MMRLSVRLGSGGFSDAEAGEIAVPVDGVPAGHRQGGDAAGGEAEGASFRHGYPRREARTRAEEPERVIKPQTFQGVGNGGGTKNAKQYGQLGIAWHCKDSTGTGRKLTPVLGKCISI